MVGLNPNAPPVADFGAAVPPNEHEATRRRLIATESNLRSLGALVVFGGAVSVSMGIGAVGKSAVEGSITLVVAGVSIFAGLALRNLDRLGRALYTVLVAVGVVRIAWAYSTVTAAIDPPPGVVPGMLAPLVVAALFLALVWGKNAKEIFTDHYRRVVIPATPYVEAKISVVVIAVIVMLVLGVLAAIVAT